MLVGFDGDALTRKLAHTLTAPGPSPAFLSAGTEVLMDPRTPGEVLDAVRRAARATTDVLLFYFAGPGHHEAEEPMLGVSTTDPEHLADTAVGLGDITSIIKDSPATRPVLILDSEVGFTAGSWCRKHAPDVSLLTVTTPSSHPFAWQFTGALIEALVHGVDEGPEVLNLRDLDRAIVDVWWETPPSFEADGVPYPSQDVVVRGGQELALGRNPAY
ncbi:hypothetical protein ACWCPM_07515 [Streptomyces sp. NPDC002309]